MITSKFVKTLATVCVVAICSFGLVACQGAGGGTAATVNGTPIPEDQITKTIQNVRAQSGLEDKDAWGEFLAANNMTPESVRGQIIDSLVTAELVKQGASELGISVDSTEVDTYVSSIKANFDNDEAWKKSLENAGFTEESYRESIEESLLTQAVGKHFEEEANVGDEDVAESAKSYATYFDGARRSSHILFKVENPSDEAAMSAAREKAQSVLDQINNGLDFAEAAKQYSDDSSAERGGDVGWDRTTTFVTAYQDALKELEPGQVSGLVETEYGIHIIKCTDKFSAPEDVTSIDQLPEELRETVASMATSTKANNDYNAWVEGLRDKAEIVIKDMPSDVPYNVDMSKYGSASAEAGSEEAASDEAASSGSADAAESASAESASSGAASSSSSAS